MKFFTLITLLVSLIFAQNPRVYSAIADEVYNDVDSVEHLSTLQKYKTDIDNINKYVNEVREAKEVAYKIEAKESGVNPSEYLKTIRKLSKKNSYYKREVESTFNESVKNEDSKLFSEMINSKLLNTDRNKSIIVKYYLAHQDEVEAVGVIKEYLAEDEALRRQRDAWREAAKRKEAAKIKRIRDNDKAKQEALNEQLTNEVIQKKKDIRTEQKKELSIK